MTPARNILTALDYYLAKMVAVGTVVLLAVLVVMCAIVDALPAWAIACGTVAFILADRACFASRRSAFQSTIAK